LLGVSVRSDTRTPKYSGYQRNVSVSRELLAFDVCRGVMDKLSGDFIEVTRRVSTP